MDPESAQILPPTPRRPRRVHKHTQATSCIPEVTRDAVNPFTKELVYLGLGNLTQSRRMCSFSSSSNQGEPVVNQRQPNLAIGIQEWCQLHCLDDANAKLLQVAIRVSANGLASELAM